MVDIKGEGGLLTEGIRHLDFMPGFNIEGFPNRDSMIYRELYGIDDVHTLLRGTIRYRVSIIDVCILFSIKVYIRLRDTSYHMIQHVSRILV